MEVPVSFIVIFTLASGIMIIRAYSIGYARGREIEAHGWRLEIARLARAGREWWSYRDEERLPTFKQPAIVDLADLQKLKAAQGER